MTRGQKLVALYFVATYGLPMAASLLFGERLFSAHYMSSVVLMPLTGYALGVLLATYGLFWALTRSRIGIFHAIDLRFFRTPLRRLGSVYLRARLPFAACGAVFAAFSYLSSLNLWRYANVNVSDAESPFLLVFITLTPLVSADMFYFIFVDAGQERLSRRRHAENILMSATLLLSAAGTVGMMTALFASFYSVAPQPFRSLLVAPERRQAMLRRLLRLSAALALLVTLFPAAWFTGETIKADFDSTAVAQRISTDRVEEAFFYLIARVSTYYYSYLYASGGEVFDCGVSNPILLPLKTLAYHADFLAGRIVGVERPEIPSMSRLNYLLVYGNGPIGPRTGASPGLLASFEYSLGFPLNVIFGALYLCWLSSMIDGLFQGHRASLSGLGSLLLLHFTHVFFQCPFDLLTLDDGTVYTAAIVMISIASRLRPTRSLGGDPVIV